MNTTLKPIAAAALVSGAIGLLTLSGMNANAASPPAPRDGVIHEAAARVETLLEGQGVKVTVADVLAEAARVPLPARDELFRDPNGIAQLAANVYVRRALAAEAVKTGLAQDPTVAVQLVLARERALADAQLARLEEKNRPTDSATEQYAKSAYQANPQRFAMPDEVHARHILVTGTGAESRAKAEALLAKLKQNNGADFETLAREQSQDPGSAPQGGDLGFFSRGRMVKPFEDAAFELTKPGELSGIVESPFGFHIIQLVERRPAGTRPFTEVEGALRAEAAQKVMADARNAKAKTLLAEAKFNRDAIEALGAAEQQRAMPSKAEATKPIQ